MSNENSPQMFGSGQPVVLIAGPTASGKSDLAVRLAKTRESRGLRSIVINADSAQVYADLSVLSARPSDEEMAGIPHRLFGAWDGATACSAADWATAAKVEIQQAHASDALPILVGGTGLYIRTLLEGIAPIPPIDPTIRQTVRSLPVAECYAALQEEDPIRAASLAPNDASRIARALEVIRSTGRPLAHWQTRKEGGIEGDISIAPLLLTAEREWLYDRCDLRFERMMQNGAIEEVAELLARSLDPTMPVMRAIGVPEIAAFLRGHMARADAVAAGQQATRNYAKRQFTWFRRQLPEHWMRANANHSEKPIDYEILFPKLLLT
ncbi:tRNA (adenosine(37)-N6)-dimethylallyltransferase MiaA [Tsuneonella suprasediminis]|uniref:tRNA (adenosine(37)-N6)-dimethylallyltransferase MiaA n=1 Tax=Tsuneonella suprasediminis TaxID=2306996 RepID=UPI002F92B517